RRPESRDRLYRGAVRLNRGHQERRRGNPRGGRRRAALSRPTKGRTSGCSTLAFLPQRARRRRGLALHRETGPVFQDGNPKKLSTGGTSAGTLSAVVGRTMVEGERREPKVRNAFSITRACSASSISNDHSPRCWT